MKSLFVLFTTLLITTQAQARTVLYCPAEQKGFLFKFVGETTGRIEALVIKNTNENGETSSHAFKSFPHDVFKGERFDFNLETGKLIVTPDPNDFPEGLFLKTNGCDA
jgi:hypothetical protein